MTKILLFISVFNFTFLSLAQGNLRVIADKNETGILKNNKTLDTISLIITSTYGERKQEFMFTPENNNCQLSPGYYNLSFMLEGRIAINICDVLIRDNEFTFIQILIEPTIDLNWIERQKRKKTYDNFKKNNCT